MRTRGAVGLAGALLCVGLGVMIGSQRSTLAVGEAETEEAGLLESKDEIAAAVLAAVVILLVRRASTSSRE